MLLFDDELYPNLPGLDFPDTDTRIAAMQTGTGQTGRPDSLETGGSDRPIPPGPVRPDRPTPPGPVRPDRPIPPGPVRPDRPIPPEPVRPDRPTPPGPVRPDRPTPPGPVRPDRPNPPGPVRPDRPNPPGPVRPDRPTPPGSVRPDRPNPPGPVRPDRPIPPWQVRPDRPTPPLPGSNRSSIRFLYAAVNQPAVNIQIGNRTAITNFQYSNVTPYYRESSGNRRITIISARNPRTVLYQGTFTFLPNTAYTLSLINDRNGIAVFSVVDHPCRSRFNSGCVRAINLSRSSGPLDVFLSGNGRIFRNLTFQSVSSSYQVPGGRYRAFVSEALPCTANAAAVMNNSFVSCNGTRLPVLDTTVANIRNGVPYTFYIIGSAFGYPALQIISVESDF